MIGLDSCCGDVFEGGCEVRCDEERGGDIWASNEDFIVTGVSAVCSIVVDGVEAIFFFLGIETFDTVSAGVTTAFVAAFRLLVITATLEDLELVRLLGGISDGGEDPNDIEELLPSWLSISASTIMRRFNELLSFTVELNPFEVKLEDLFSNFEFKKVSFVDEVHLSSSDGTQDIFKGSVGKGGKLASFSWSTESSVFSSCKLNMDDFSLLIVPLSGFCSHFGDREWYITSLSDIVSSDATQGERF